MMIISDRGGNKMQVTNSNAFNNKIAKKVHFKVQVGPTSLNSVGMTTEQVTNISHTCLLIS